MKTIESLIEKNLEGLNLEERVEFLNQIKLFLHKKSPFKSEPVDCVIWLKNEYVYANDYNPNSVAPPEMKLLSHSVDSDGYTQPIVAFKPQESKEEKTVEVVDGFHRTRVGKEVDSIRKRVYGYLPVVVINEDREGRGDRIASTIRHNRARGKHAIEKMSDIILELKKRNWSDKKIGNELGMDPDEVLRLAQITGLAEMFSDKEFSEAWEADVIDEEDNLQEISNQL